MNPEREKIIAAAKKEAARHKRELILRRVGIWGGALALLTIMIWGLANLASTPATNDTAGTLAEAVDSKVDHIEGTTNAKVVLVEYSDFQCPACGQFYPVVKNLMSKYGKQIEMVYRYFPLSQHDKSNLASKVAEAAGNQGKFWEMHDKLFEGQTLWTDKTESEATKIFNDYASQIGLDKVKFSADLNTTTTVARIARDLQSGNQSNIDGTPTFFLNDKKLTNLQNYADLEADVAGAISESK